MLRLAVWMLLASSAVGCAEPIPSADDVTNSAPASPGANLVSSGKQQRQPANSQTAAGAPQPVSASGQPEPIGAPDRGPLPLPTSAPPAPMPLASPLPASDPELRINLFGVALAQTLPDGSAMGFSLEYNILAGQLESSAVYLWVIEPPQGSPWRQQVTLQDSGNLVTFVKEWPPLQGTYTTYIEQADPSSRSRKIVSKRLQLTY